MIIVDAIIRMITDPMLKATGRLVISFKKVSWWLFSSVFCRLEAAAATIFSALLAAFSAFFAAVLAFFSALRSSLELRLGLSVIVSVDEKLPNEEKALFIMDAAARPGLPEITAPLHTVALVSTGSQSSVMTAWHCIAMHTLFRRQGCPGASHHANDLHVAPVHRSLKFIQAVSHSLTVSKDPRKREVFVLARHLALGALFCPG